MKTTLHRYAFDVSKPEEAKAYRELKYKLRADPGRGHLMNCLASSGENRLPEDGATFTLETEFLFENQWNAAPTDGETIGRRLFDWYQPIYPNNKMKLGYYLDITPEMQEIRRTTLKCGYCGKQYPSHSINHACIVDGAVFCNACLDSPYLKEDQLHLLRLLPIEVEFTGVRRPLTDEERRALMPIYVKRQTEGDDSRAVQRKAKQRDDVQKKYVNTLAHAANEYNGMVWLFDHGIDIENVIYYNHTGMFSFGWRSPITSEEVREKLRSLLKEFPYAFVIESKSKY